VGVEPIQIFQRKNLKWRAFLRSRIEIFEMAEGFWLFPAEILKWPKINDVPNPPSSASPQSPSPVRFVEADVFSGTIRRICNGLHRDGSESCRVRFGFGSVLVHFGALIINGGSLLVRFRAAGGSFLIRWFCAVARIQ
jgi:hypothetical protein